MSPKPRPVNLLRWCDRYAGQHILVALGLAMAIATFLHNRSLWLDEAMLSLNFLTRNALQLLAPLDYDQVAPVGYLWIVKALFELCELLGIPVEYGLRAPSLAAFFGVIYLTYDVGRRLMGSPLAALTAAAFVSCNAYAIRYGTEVKQYMLDTCVGLAILAVTLRVIRSPREAHVASYAVFGALCIWLSNTAVLFLACAGGYVVVTTFLADRSLRWAWAPVTWVSSLGIYYGLFIHDHPTRDKMLQYWRDAFMPWPPWSSHMGEFVDRQVGGAIRDMLAGRFYVLAALLLATSLGVAIWRKNLLLVLFTTAPAALHLLMSALKLYPFAHRLAIYLIPTSAWLFGFITGEIERALGGRRWVSVTAALPLCIVVAISAAKFPFEHEELRDNLEGRSYAFRVEARMRLAGSVSLQ